jgi:hypothetical protein
MKIIFLTQVSFSQNDFHRFGVEIMTQLDTEVECWDMTELLNPKVWEARQHNVFRFSGYQQISSIRTIENLCHDLRNVVAIDLLRIGHTHNRIRSMIKRASGRLCLLEQGTLPLELFQEQAFYKKITLKRILEKYRGYGPFSIIKSAIHAFHEKRRPESDYQLVSGTSSLPHKNSCTINTQKIWAHAFDYNLFLQLQGQNRKKNTIVFIDTGLTGSNPDFSMFNAKAFATKENHRISMDRVFSTLEKHFSASIIIAGHPKVNYEKEPHPFGQREVYIGKTSELIRDCRIVVSNGSTADNLAVLWRKPLLLITTNEIEGSVQKSFLNATADLLGTQTINADDCLDNIDWSSISQKPITNYDNFRNKLIKKDGTPEKNSWIILIEFLKREKENHK